MINVIGWFLCGAVVGLAAARRDAARRLAVALFTAAGTLGALCGGLVLFIFDTTPLHALSPIGLLGACAGAIALVVIARRLAHTTA
jgi:uncharacterized membrane protein YeaQ/YmgE (transglycosylase-associated protein family)